MAALGSDSQAVGDPMTRCARCLHFNICNLSVLPDYGCINWTKLP